MAGCFSETGQLSAHCFETVLQTMAEGVFIVDTDGIIRFCNAAMGRLAGGDPARFVGRTCNEILACSCGTIQECGLFKTGEINNAECALIRRDGGTLPVLKNGRIIRDSSGATIGAVETLTDISALKRSEYRLAELEKAAQTTGQFGNIIGKSHPIRAVFNLIELSAASNATVLVTGETGTGKELVATAIHDLSGRKNGPMVKINCSALPESLLESELFGHTRGAFTGAVKDKLGRFEIADGGTIFLDEIGEISPLIQVKLLRFLQEREFERVGESVTRKSDVRIIAATNRNLLDMVHEGTFREDLYYRLKVFPIHLPALRDRKEDIGLLVDHFVARFNEETGKGLTGLTHDAALTLMDYCWPGNIRELENAIEHAFVTCRNGLIDLFDLPLEIRKVELRSGMCLSGDDGTLTRNPGSLSPPYPRKRTFTRDELLELLNRFKYNKTRVAEHLGVDRTTVWRQMKRLGL